MIQVYINPAGVEKVIFVAESDLEADFDFAAWQVVQPFVGKINRKLRRVVRELEQRDSSRNGDTG